MMLQVPHNFLTESRDFRLEVSGSGDVEFTNSSSLSLLEKTVSIFVQTDKKRYKPGSEGTASYQATQHVPIVPALTPSF